MACIAECRWYARECREMTSSVRSERDRQILELMATAWDQIADELDAQAFAETVAAVPGTGGPRRKDV